MFETISQIVIFITGVPAIMMLSIGGKWRRIGCGIALFGQIFWLYSTYNHEQWGIFSLAVWYVFAYSIGLAKIDSLQNANFVAKCNKMIKSIIKKCVKSL
ncbi:MAG: hypothetical protein QQN41_06130 [Nitrosopumilus sp.]